MSQVFERSTIEKSNRSWPLLVRTVFICGLYSSGQNVYGISVNLPANIDIATSAAIAFQYDDNVFLSREHRIDDWVSRASPMFRLTRDGPASSLSGEFVLTHAHYRDGTRDSFNDYEANIDWRWRAASLLEVQVSASYLDVAQTIDGVSDSGLDSILIEPERTRMPSAEIAVALGRREGRLNGIIRRGQRDSEFDTPERNYSSAYYVFGTSYLVNENISFGLELSNTAVDYEDLRVAPERNSVEKVVLATTEYKLPKTRLMLRAGRLHKEFEFENRDKFEGPRWDFTASWSPKKYSVFSVTAGRNIQESLGDADFIDAESKAFTWSHQWAETLTSSFSYSQTIGEFVGIEQESEVMRSSFDIQYQPLDWLKLKLGVSALENRSSEIHSILENNRYIFVVEAPL